MTTKLERVYVWELPVRIFHWLNALCILVLAVTGLMIGWPIALTNSQEASFSYWFGTTRFIHFVAAYVLTFNFLLRIYWAFVGNRFASWRNFLPATRRQWVEVWDVLKVDILQFRRKPLDSLGHNSLASLTYLASFLVFLFQVVSGFGLYAAMSDARIPSLFRWIVPLMGGDLSVRQWHHMFTWFFVLFTLVHVYLVAYHDYVEGRGGMSSMVGGWKFSDVEEPANGTRS